MERDDEPLLGFLLEGDDGEVPPVLGSRFAEDIEREGVLDERLVSDDRHRLRAIRTRQGEGERSPAPVDAVLLREGVVPVLEADRFPVEVGFTDFELLGLFAGTVAERLVHGDLIGGVEGRKSIDYVIMNIDICQIMSS